MGFMRCVHHSGAFSTHQGIRVETCRRCRTIRLLDTAGETDGWNCMSALFGDYELVGRVDALHAPATEVLAYRSPDRAGAGSLRVAPPHRWFRVNECLWMCHDGRLLLLAHGSPSVSRMVGA